MVDPVVYTGMAPGGDGFRVSVLYPFATATGSTASRPTSPANGFLYLDTTLGIPIWALSTSGTGWINAAGFAV